MSGAGVDYLRQLPPGERLYVAMRTRSGLSYEHPLSPEDARAFYARMTEQTAMPWRELASDLLEASEPPKEEKPPRLRQLLGPPKDPVVGVYARADGRGAFMEDIDLIALDDQGRIVMLILDDAAATWKDAASFENFIAFLKDPPKTTPLEFTPAEVLKRWGYDCATKKRIPPSAPKVEMEARS